MVTTALVPLAERSDPDVGLWVPYVVVLGLVGLLVLAAVWWLLRGRTARTRDRRGDASDDSRGHLR